MASGVAASVLDVATPEADKDEKDSVVRTRVVVLLAAAASIFLLAGWFLWPASLGGRATYVATHGVSMQPRFHTGDLAIVYPASRYEPGEIAAYRSDLLHAVVLHRVIATAPDGYVLKGDNNAWRDPEQPANEQMVGRLGIRVPYGGIVLGWLNQPPMIGLFAAAILTGGATSAARLRRRRRRRQRRRAAQAERTPMNLRSLYATSRAQPRSAAFAAAAAGTLALLCAGLASATYVVPGKSFRAEDVPWTTQVTYAYSAATAPNVVYPDGQVVSGQTVFRKLVDHVTVRATWSLRTRAEHDINGTARLQAIVRGPAGWSHPVDLSPTRAFTGDRVDLTGTLDLGALDDVVTHAGDLTGIRSDRYTVSLQPVLDLNGTIAGAPVDPSEQPEAALSFAITPDTVTPSTAAPADTGSATGQNTTHSTEPTAAAGSAAPSRRWLSPDPTTHTTAVRESGLAAWNVWGHRVPVTAIRWAGISGAVLGLLVLVGLLTAKPRRNDPCVREARRHRGSIVSINSVHIAPASNVLEVASMKSLAQVAQRYDRLILRQANAPGVFLVEDETGLYRYQCTHHQDDELDSRRHPAERPRTEGPVPEYA